MQLQIKKRVCSSTLSRGRRDWHKCNTELGGQNDAEPMNWFRHPYDSGWEICVASDSVSYILLINSVRDSFGLLIWKMFKTLEKILSIFGLLNENCTPLLLKQLNYCQCYAWMHSSGCRGWGTALQLRAFVTAILKCVTRTHCRYVYKKHSEIIECPFKWQSWNKLSYFKQQPLHPVAKLWSYFYNSL